MYSKSTDNKVVHIDREDLLFLATYGHNLKLDANKLKSLNELLKKFSKNCPVTRVTTDNPDVIDLINDTTYLVDKNKYLFKGINEIDDEINRIKEIIDILDERFDDKHPYYYEYEQYRNTNEELFGNEQRLNSLEKIKKIKKSY